MEQPKAINGSKTNISIHPLVVEILKFDHSSTPIHAELGYNAISN
jgi:hypothetical protein